MPVTIWNAWSTCWGMDREPTESLWVRIRGRTRPSLIIVGIFYRPPDQEDHVNEALYRQTEAILYSQVLVLMGDHLGFGGKTM